jgi:hypothetical protein
MPLPEMVTEHRTYLAMAGIFLVAALAVFLLVRQLSRKPCAFAIGVLAFIVPLAGLTHARNLVWVDELTLWAEAVAKNPESARGQIKYGQELMARGQLEPADAALRCTRKGSNRSGSA